MKMEGRQQTQLCVFYSHNSAPGEIVFPTFDMDKNQ